MIHALRRLLNIESCMRNITYARDSHDWANDTLTRFNYISNLFFFFMCPSAAQNCDTSSAKQIKPSQAPIAHIFSTTYPLHCVEWRIGWKIVVIAHLPMYDGDGRVPAGVERAKVINCVPCVKRHVKTKLLTKVRTFIGWRQYFLRKSIIAVSKATKPLVWTCQWEGIRDHFLINCVLAGSMSIDVCIV